MQRQPTQHTAEASNNNHLPLARSHTISGDVRPRNKQDSRPIELAGQESQTSGRTASWHEEMKDRHHHEAVAEPQLKVSTKTEGSDDSIEAGGAAVKELTPSAQKGSISVITPSTQGPSISVITPSTPENEETKQVTFEEMAEGKDERVKTKPEDGDGAELPNKGKRRPLVRSHSVEDSVRKTPGFKFITRPDLYKFAKVST